MEIILIFAIIAAIILVGFFGEWLFEKTHVPDVLWLILFGILLKYLLEIDMGGLKEASTLFITFALVFILFEGILNFTVKKMVRGFREGASLAFFNLIVSALACGMVMHLVGWSFIGGMLLGAILADSSQAVIVPLVKKIRIGQESALTLIFESAITDVFCIVGSLTLISILLLKSVTVVGVLSEVARQFLIAIGIGLLMGVIWVELLARVEKFTRSSIPSIAVLLITYCLAEYFGANGLMACLFYGIILGNSRKIFPDLEHLVNAKDKFFYSEITFFLKTFFFVYMGMVIEFGHPGLLLLGFLIAVILFLARPISVLLSGIKPKGKDLAYLEVMNPKGLAAAVLAQLPLLYGIDHAAEYSTIVMTVIAASVLLTAIFVPLVERCGYSGMLGMLARLRKAKSD
jgi:NhaP-type Na+/H+ or K+/H+ antiporter